MLYNLWCSPLYTTTISGVFAKRIGYSIFNYLKARNAADVVFTLLHRIPAIDVESNRGIIPVRMIVTMEVCISKYLCYTVIFRIAYMERLHFTKWSLPIRPEKMWTSLKKWVSRFYVARHWPLLDQVGVARAQSQLYWRGFMIHWVE